MVYIASQKCENKACWPIKMYSDISEIGFDLAHLLNFDHKNTTELLLQWLVLYSL